MKKLVVILMAFALFAMVFTACTPVDGGDSKPASTPSPNAGATPDPDPTPDPAPQGPQPITPEVGAVFMSDGTCWTVDTYTSHLETAIPVGIVCRVYEEDGTVKGYILGLRNTNDGSGKKRWAPNSKSSIRSNSYSNFACDQWGGGDTYGGDNYISGSAVFQYASDYGNREEFASTSFNSGWYVPTVYEMKEYICGNYSILTDVLAAIGGTPFASDYYWTSNQSKNTSYTSYRLKPPSKTIDEYAKDGDCHVCVLHTF